jgi:transcriptional regulator with XRE-family HTH domain
MTNNELIKAFEMKLNGYSYETIAKKLGYTRQNINCELHKVLSDRPFSIGKSIFPNLVREIKFRYKTLNKFCEVANIDYGHMSGMLRGKVKATADDVFVCCKIFEKEWSYLFDRSDTE